MSLYSAISEFFDSSYKEWFKPKLKFSYHEGGVNLVNITADVCLISDCKYQSSLTKQWFLKIKSSDMSESPGFLN